MAPSVYTISFILEKIHRTLAQSFFLSLRFEEHDWCRVGEFDDSDLPVGFMFTTILSSFNNADKFKMEINVSSKSSFLACVQFSKSIGADILSTRGLSVLYSEDNDQSVMAITIAVRVVRYYHSPRTEKSITRDDGVQTDQVEMRTVQTQVQPCCTNTGSNTELYLLSENELEHTVATVVAQHLEDMKTVDAKKKEQRYNDKHPPTAPCHHFPSPAKEKNRNLGNNVVPRLQKLRVLDKMIGERAAVVEQFDESLVKMEIARKRDFIRKSRSILSNLTKAKTSNKDQGLASVLRLRNAERPKSRDAATQSERPPLSEEQSQSSSERTSSASSSTSSEAAVEEEEQATESSSTASTRSSSSSRATVLRRNSTTSANSQATVKSNELASNAERHQRNQMPSHPPLSPTSLYLKQLREKILQERMQKV